MPRNTLKRQSKPTSESENREARSNDPILRGQVVSQCGKKRSAALKREVAQLVDQQDSIGLAALAQNEGDRILRHLLRYLYSSDTVQKFKAVETLGALAQNHALLDAEKLREILRRFVWALNDESGAVPYGIPEAMGEILYRRPELQADFLPILCGLLVHDEISQTGMIEQGAVWAVLRVGKVCFEVEPRLVTALTQIQQQHGDAHTRALAKQALASLD